MDAALSVTTHMALVKALNRHFTRASLGHCCPSQQLLHRRLTSFSAHRNYSSRRSNNFDSSSLRSLCAVLPPIRCRVQCVSSSTASFGGGNGGAGGDGGGGGGGGGNGGESGDANPKLVGEGPEELLALNPDVVILDVSGMVCGGCASNVKRILEMQPKVSSASVNLTTETAIVWPVSGAKVAPNWQKQLGEALAEHLTNCGFKSSFRGQEDSK